MATEAQITIRFGYTNKRYFILKHFQVYKYNNILRLFFDKQITIFIFLQIFEKSILQFECERILRLPDDDGDDGSRDEVETLQTSR